MFQSTITQYQPGYANNSQPGDEIVDPGNTPGNEDTETYVDEQQSQNYGNEETLHIPSQHITSNIDQTLPSPSFCVPSLPKQSSSFCVPSLPSQSSRVPSLPKQSPSVHAPSLPIPSLPSRVPSLPSPSLRARSLSKQSPSVRVPSVRVPSVRVPSIPSPSKSISIFETSKPIDDVDEKRSAVPEENVQSYQSSSSVDRVIRRRPSNFEQKVPQVSAPEKPIQRAIVVRRNVIEGEEWLKGVRYFLINGQWVQESDVHVEHILTFQMTEKSKLEHKRRCSATKKDGYPCGRFADTRGLYCKAIHSYMYNIE